MHRRTRALVVAAVVGLCAGLAVAAQPAGAATPTGTGVLAPLDRPGPALQVPVADLQRSLACTADVATAGTSPILLIPGTTLTPDENFSWNYERAFAAHGRPYCAVTLPDHALGDIQISAEYVVYSIREMQRRSGHQVSVLGFSQGGMIGRWALRFWPDTRRDVGDVIGLDPSNRGSLEDDVLCSVTPCAPAVWQQQISSNFYRALNSRAETFAGIDYTVIYSPTDEVVFPNFPPFTRSALTTGAGRRANLSTFDVCPGHLAGHLQMGSSDAVGYAYVVDALDHAGPADPARISRAVCWRPLQEGVDPLTFGVRFAAYAAGAQYQALTYPKVPAEPPLQSYVYASGSAA